MIAITGKCEKEKGNSLNRLVFLFPFSLFLFAYAFGYPAPRIQGPLGDEEPPEKLSAYGLFTGNGSSQEPVPGVIPYDLNTPLFADYALKYRFIKLPPGSHASYHDTEVFDFPVGTVISKTFAFAKNLSDPSKGRQLIETRLLIHKPTGWIGLPYIWNEEQTEATLEIAGGTVDVKWVHTGG